MQKYDQHFLKPMLKMLYVMMRLTVTLKYFIQSSVPNFYPTANMREIPDLSGDGCLHVEKPAKISHRRAPLFTSVLSALAV